MDFGFSADQLLLQKTVRDFLEGECSPEWVRGQWETDTGRSPAFWAQLAEIGIPGLIVSEAHGGLGMDETDLVLLLEEVGRIGLAEPIVSTAVGTALLASLPEPDMAAAWLPKVAAGDAILAIAHPQSPFVADAHVADLLIAAAGDELHALPPGAVKLEAQQSNDGAQRLFRVSFEPSPATRIAQGEDARLLIEAALDRGAVFSAAQALGVADQLVKLAADYAGQRVQFGVPIGSFQAVKHMLADVMVKTEYARSHVHRAGYSVAHATSARSVDVSMAKIGACEAALAAARASLQVHGAIGYTYEQDVHVWMKRAWSLDLAFGDSVFHRNRLCAGVIDRTIPAASFGYSPAGN
ncbi:MAG: acyl-CoA dehydrogenase family protein [Myxococcota bacterium]|nr:acyl-CoA dehydrogenase family protein [Myxococcota bacterium]